MEYVKGEEGEDMTQTNYNIKETQTPLVSKQF